MNRIPKIHLALMKYRDMMELVDIIQTKLQVNNICLMCMIKQFPEELDLQEQMKYPDIWRNTNGYTSMVAKMVSK